jgi:hypothetical protein
LVGFSTNPANPFECNGSLNSNNQWVPGNPRTTLLYDFNTARLANAPGQSNGSAYWQAYYPDTASGGSPVVANSTATNTFVAAAPPYVYFRSRGQGTTSLTNSNPISNGYDNVGLTGTAGNGPNGTGPQKYYYTSTVGGQTVTETVTPYFNSLTSQWMLPTKFQIIASGFDGLFGTCFQVPLSVQSPWSSSSAPGLSGPTCNPPYPVPAENDNLTNFTSGALEDYRGN